MNEMSELCYSVSDNMTASGGGFMNSFGHGTVGGTFGASQENVENNRQEIRNLNLNAGGCMVEVLDNNGDNSEKKDMQNAFMARQQARLSAAKE